MLDLSRYADHRNLVFLLIILGGVGFALVLYLGSFRYSMRTVWSLAVGWGWLCALAVLTLVPVDLGGNSVNLIPLHGLWGDAFSILNFGLNILLFTPSGALIAYSRAKPRIVWILATVIISIAIELAQHYGDLGRAGDINDVLAGALGLAAGVVVAGGFGHARRRTVEPTAGFARVHRPASVHVPRSGQGA